MRTLAIIAACAAWMCVDCNRAEASPATDAIKACAPYRELIADAAEAASVPVALLTALVFAESTCNPAAVNASSGAIGLGQILPGTMADGNRKRVELFSVDVNLALTAEHLRRCYRLCKSWRGAVGVYHGNPTCKTPSRYADKVIRIWHSIEHSQNPRS